MTDLTRQIREIFDDAQKTTASHLRNSILLKKFIDSNDFDEATDELIEIIKVLLVYDYKTKNSYHVRAMKFITSFCKDLEPKNCENDEIEDSPILWKIFDFLLEISEIVNDSCRYWSCSLINSILTNLTSLSNELYDRIRIAMLNRINDPKSIICLQALYCLIHFQDPTDPDDEITNEFKSLLVHDNAQIRAFVVENIALTQKILLLIVTRVRDINPIVRLKALNRIAKYMASINITKRQMIVISGINENNEKVQNFFFTSFLNIWLDSYERNYLKLMKSLRLDADQRDIDKTCKLIEIILPKLFVDKTFEEIFGVLGLTSNKLLDINRITFESVLYWRILIDFSANQSDVILPECVTFCKFVRNFLTNYQNEHKQFILQQLFKISLKFDVGDSASCAALHDLICHILETQELNLEVVDVLIRNLARTHENVRNLIVECCEIISSIKYPSNNQINDNKDEEIKNELRVIQKEKEELNQLLQKAIEISDFDQAEYLENKIKNLDISKRNLEETKEDNNFEEEINERTTDVKNIRRYMMIMHALLRSRFITQLTPELALLHEENIRHHLIHPDEEIRIKSLICCALIGMLDKKIAQDIIHWFAVPLVRRQDGSSDELLVACIKAIIDLLTIHGSYIVANSDQLDDSQNEEHIKVFIGGTSITEIINAILDLIQSDSNLLREAATEAICNFVLHNSIRSTNIIVRLILIWSNPATDTFVLTLIGSTLGKIPKIQNYTNHLQEAIPIVMQTVLKAPLNSPFSDIDPIKLAKFLISLSATSHDYINIHSYLIDRILDILNEDDSGDEDIIDVYTKMLLMIDLNVMEIDQLQHWARYSERICKSIESKTIKKSIGKFKKKILLLLAEQTVEQMVDDESDSRLSPAVA